MLDFFTHLVHVIIIIVIVMAIVMVIVMSVCMMSVRVGMIIGVRLRMTQAMDVWGTACIIVSVSVIVIVIVYWYVHSHYCRTVILHCYLLGLEHFYLWQLIIWRR